MSNNAASDNTLGLLHSALAKLFMAQLEKPEELTSKDVANMLKYLKDNDITCDVEQDSIVNQLKERLESRTIVPELLDDETEYVYGKI